MYPVLFKIGPFALYSLWAGVLIGFFVATVLFLKRAKYERMDLNFILGHGLSLLIGSFLFSRSCFFFANWGYFGQFSIINFLKQLLFFWQPGYSFWGAIWGYGVSPSHVGANNIFGQSDLPTVYFGQGYDLFLPLGLQQAVLDRVTRLRAVN